LEADGGIAKPSTNEELFQAFMNRIRHDAKAILQSGVSLHQVLLDSGAIHICAANKSLRFTRLFLDLLVDSAAMHKNEALLNDPDRTGLTPVMVAADNVTLDDLKSCAFRQYIEYLQSQGADNKLVLFLVGSNSTGILSCEISAHDIRFA
jgi:hypothetical protein